MKEFSFRTRKKNIEKLKAESFDLLIIGGGITGAGAARDAASRGMKVGLIEARDFASGTSSRSSKLIHGGIRYLENLEFGLVYEALTERSLLFELAPHLVHPLRFMLPVYDSFRVGMFKLGLGMWLYDVLSLFETPEFHEALGVQNTLQRSPSLRKQGLKGAFVYSDAYMDDDRLVIETLRSANEMGACSANYVSAEGVKINNEKISEVTCKDYFTGEEFSVKAQHVISSVGPWTDELGSKMFAPWKKRLRPSKGIHLTFSRERFPLNEAVVMAADKEARIVFGIPRHEMVIVGTTDTDYPGDPRDVKTEKEDVDYLLSVVDEYFPGAKLTEKDIMASYSGIRPLVDDGASTEGKTSREHLIFNDPKGVTFVMGGKYTTYRLMAEQTVDMALKGFSQEDRVRFCKSNTKNPLNKKATLDYFTICEGLKESWAKDSGVSLGVVSELIARHGGEAEDILKQFSDLVRNDGSSDFEVLWQLEAHQAIHNTMCCRLEDYYLRRTPLFLSAADHGFGILEPLARLFKNRLSLSDSEGAAQIDGVKQHLAKEMGWSLA